VRPTSTQVEAAERNAAESQAPKAQKILQDWRAAIARAARAHHRYRAMNPGPERDALAELLREFNQTRSSTARTMSLELARNEGGLPDFEQVAGTALLVTDPDMPSAGMTAAPVHLGLVWFAWVPILILSGGAVYGTVVLSHKLAEKAAGWAETLFYLGLAAGGGWLVYKLIAGRSTPAAPARIGVTY
jgi:hypothetical protein